MTITTTTILILETFGYSECTSPFDNHHILSSGAILFSATEAGTQNVRGRVSSQNVICCTVFYTTYFCYCNECNIYLNIKREYTLTSIYVETLRSNRSLWPNGCFFLANDPIALKSDRVATYERCTDRLGSVRLRYAHPLATRKYNWPTRGTIYTSMLLHNTQTHITPLSISRNTCHTDILQLENEISFLLVLSWNIFPYLLLFDFSSYPNMFSSVLYEHE